MLNKSQYLSHNPVVTFLRLPLIFAGILMFQCLNLRAQELIYVMDVDNISGESNGSRIVGINPDTGDRKVISGACIRGGRGLALDASTSEIFVADQTDSSGSSGMVWVIPAVGHAEVFSGWYVGSAAYGAGLWDAVNLLLLPDGDLLVAQPDEDNIVRIDRATGNRSLLSGGGVGTGTNFSLPLDMALGANDTLYVADGSRITQVGLGNGARTIISSSSVGEGPSLGSVAGIAMDGAGGLLALTNGPALLRINLETGDRSTVSNNGTNFPGPKFSSPANLLVLANGDVLVTDVGLDAILRVAPDGNRTLFSGVTDFDTAGSGPAFEYPYDLIQLPSGNLLVTDDALKAVLEVDTSGNRSYYEASLVGGTEALFQSPAAVEPSIYGGLLVTDYELDALIYVDVDTGQRSVVSGGTPGVGTGEEFETPGSVVERSADAIYVADSYKNAVLKVDPFTGNRQIISGAGVGTGPAIYDLTDLGMDSSRRLFALDYHDGLLSLNEQNGNRNLISDGTGQSNGGVGTGPGFTYASAMYLGLNGLTYVADLDYDAIISVNLADGNRTLVSGDPQGNNLGSGPRMDYIIDIDMEADGSLAVMDNENQRVLRVVAGGNREVVSGALVTDPDNWRGTGAPFEELGACAVQRAPGTPLPVVLQVGETNITVDANAGSHALALQRFGGGTLSWTAEVIEGASWLTVPASGSAGQLGLNYAGNPNAFARTARVSIAANGATGLPVEVVVTQSANTAQITVSPAPTLSIGGTAGTSTLTLTRAGAGPLAWSTTITGGTWVEVTGGASGTGNGDILLAYEANPSLQSRAATLRVSATIPGTQNIDIAIVQAPGGSSPVLSVSPLTRAVTSAAGTTTFNVSNTGGGNFSWTSDVVSGVNWASITGGATGLNAGVITVSYSANTQATPRTATVRVTPNAAGLSPQDLTITQAQSASGPAILPSTTQLLFGVGGGSKSIGVSTTGGSLPWTASIVSGDSWLSFVGSSSGNGTGSVAVLASPNVTADARIGSIRFTSSASGVSPVTVEVAQSDVACDVPATATGVSASDGTYSNFVQVQWGAAARATGYTVYRGTTNVFAAAVPVWTGVDLSFTDYGAPAPVRVASGCSSELTIAERYYWVVASNDCGDADPSNVDAGYAGGSGKMLPGGSAPGTSPSGNAAVFSGMILSLLAYRRLLM